MKNKTLGYYNQKASVLAEQYESANVEHIHELLLQTFTSRATILEIGCGSGRDASFMHKHGYDVLAVDGSTKMIEMAKVYHPELSSNLQVMNIPDELIFEESSFDGIYSIATLMHLNQSQLDKTFKKISLLLKAEGKFLFSVSLEREENSQRYFNTLSKDEWLSYGEQYNMKLDYTNISDDGLGRDGIVWFTCVLSKVNKHN